MSLADTISVIQAPRGAAPNLSQQIAGTGSTAAGHTTGLTVGCMATLIVGATPVYALWASTNAGNVATTDVILGAYSRFDWMVEAATAFVRLEAADQSSAFTASVWTSSPT